MNNDINNKDKENQKSELELRKRRRSNQVNAFLNKYFKGLVVLFVLFIFIVAVVYIIIPRFKKTSDFSSQLIKDRKAELLREFQVLKDYQTIILDYSLIRSSDIERVKKMVPFFYTREDLFIEANHFLLENNFRVDSVVVRDISDKEEDSKHDALGRRNLPSQDEESSLDEYLKSLNKELGVWILEIDLKDIGYSDLKRYLVLMENNLKISDIYSLDFDPEARTLKVQILTYYQKK